MVERSEEWQYNAWLPPQTSFGSHIEGYERAMCLLWAEMEGRPREAGIDFLVYPYVFMCRHVVEISLKDTIQIGHRLEGNPLNFPKHHRLGELWSEARGMLRRIEGDFLNDEIEAIDQLIGELDIIDPHSMAFRYPTNKNGGPSHPGREWINLGDFQRGIEKICAFFYGVRCQFDCYERNTDC